VGLADIRTGIVRAFERVPGIGPVSPYPFRGVPGNRSLYLTRSGFEIVPAGRVKARKWRFVARLVLYWQDPEQCEKDLDELGEAIIAAVNDDPYLGGALQAGMAEITEGDDGWFQTKNSETWYRFTDFEIEVLDKKVS
jgi:hypothetical protein